MHWCPCVIQTARISRKPRGHKQSFQRFHFLNPQLCRGHWLYPRCLCFTHLFPRCRWAWPTWEALCSPTTGRQTATSPGSKKTMLVCLDIRSATSVMKRTTLQSRIIFQNTLLISIKKGYPYIIRIIIFHTVSDGASDSVGWKSARLNQHAVFHSVQIKLNFMSYLHCLVHLY